MDFKVISKNPQIIEVPNNMLKLDPRTQPIFIGYNEVIDDNDDIQQIIILTHKKCNLSMYDLKLDDDYVVIAVTILYKYIYLKYINETEYLCCSDNSRSVDVHTEHIVVEKENNKEICITQKETTHNYGDGHSNIVEGSVIISYDSLAKKYNAVQRQGRWFEAPFESKYTVISKVKHGIEHYARENIKLSDDLLKSEQTIKTLEAQCEKQQEEISMLEKTIESDKQIIDELKTTNSKIFKQSSALHKHGAILEASVAELTQKLDICASTDTHILLNAVSLLCVDDVDKRLSYLLTSIKLCETVYASDNIINILVSDLNKVIPTYLTLREHSELKINKLIFSKFGKLINKYTLFGKNADCSNCSKNTVHIPLECCHYICSSCIFNETRCRDCKCLYDLDFSIKI